MTMTLVLTGPALSERDKKLSASLAAIAYQGKVFLDDETVSRIVALLDGLQLTNGPLIDATISEGDHSTASSTGLFPPSKLPHFARVGLRALLGLNDTASRVLDFILDNNLTVSFTGAEAEVGAHMQASITSAEEITIARTEASMKMLISGMGLPFEAGQTSIERFAHAVATHGHRTSYEPEKLQALVDHGRQSGATTVHWL